MQFPKCAGLTQNIAQGGRLDWTSHHGALANIGRELI